MTFPVKMSILKVTNFCEVSVMLFKKNSTILFQGDSITDAGRTGSPDPDSSLGLGYPFFIANLLNATYPDWNLSFINRGVSGNRTLEMSARWEKDCLNLKPDLLSVLIGMNRKNKKSEQTRKKKVFYRIFHVSLRLLHVYINSIFLSFIVERP